MKTSIKTVGLFGAGVFLACSSARFDKSSGAFTLYSPERAASSNGGFAGIPTSGATTQLPRSASLQSGGVSGSGRSSLSQAGTAFETDAPAAKRMVCSSLPDPPPLRTDRWVEVTIQFHKGQLSLLGFQPVQSRKAETTKRVMGRFAAELWIGCELIDRVRFDFPLLGAEAAGPDPKTPSFEAANRLEAKVSIPQSDRAARLELVDRATNRRQVLDWPIRRTQIP